MRAVRYLRTYRLPVLGCLLGLAACGEAPDPRVSKPSEPEFVGSLACKSCHVTEFEGWRDSHHDLAMQPANASTVLGDFDDAGFEYFGTASRFYRDGERFLVRTQDAVGEDREFEIRYTYGIEPLQQYLVVFDNGHVQPLPFAWDARAPEEGGQRWYHLYPDEYIGPGDPLHWTGRQQNWNYMCAECHSTNLQLNYDLASDAFATTWSEINVGCEACHGPASLHVAAAQDEDTSDDAGLVMAFNDRDGVSWRMNAETGIAERNPFAMRLPSEPEACGRCHSRRGQITEDYEYGQPLSHTHRLALLTEPLYYADGQIRDEVYVYGSFVQSKMYQAGVTCSDCHNPHSAEFHAGDDLDAVCAQCHLPQKFADTSHHGHETVQVACVDCHMPSRVYMGVDARRDHSLRVPRPDLSVASGVPNACTMCHKDRDDAWAAQAARMWWGEPAATSDALPGIVRASLLAQLVPPLSPDEAAALRQGFVDPDPLVRHGALQAAVNFPPELLLEVVPQLLSDDVRSVRIDAASLLAQLRDYLPQQAAVAFAAAADEYRAAQHAIASQAVAHVALAEFESQLGDLELALQHADRAVAMEPGNPLARHSRGLLLVRLDRHDDALGELRAAARLAPGNARFAYVYAVALNSLGQPDEALRVLEEAAANHPEDPDIAAFLELLRAD
ncbi:MAG: ammonia-forming cytochrome c nitrite reductase subunit c552 [Woeseiaceae bacterium]|nr:ammonia-forming cytochrome c nitrite reductase subunit c552 [Woeseiaceae bacterium]NIP21071.1 ammonia-forming cytochrome c nitrite reductase subunit c552 [Woeseiaceae bacterium]NIS90043.1 ammonia-forming cytochrome c nitrite reductase subunit c552 [Woeseiaceae bacterium]